MITNERNMKMLAMHMRGMETKDIANSFGLTSNYVENLIWRLKHIDEGEAIKMKKWLSLESKILSQYYKDWLLFLAKDEK